LKGGGQFTSRVGVGGRSGVGWWPVSGRGGVGRQLTSGGRGGGVGGGGSKQLCTQLAAQSLMHTSLTPDVNKCSCDENVQQQHTHTQLAYK